MNVFIFYAEAQLIFAFFSKIQQKTEKERKMVKEH